MGTTDRDGVATFAGGCFWCLQPIFQELLGVRRVDVGYAGGHAPKPTYEQVCTGTTGHAEAVRITFDPAAISYEDLLRVFFAVHDPTTRDRQGPDVGTQYRSVVFVRNPEEKAAARRLIREIEKAGIWDAPVVTEVVDGWSFYRAEEYHQDYFRKNPDAGYCRAVIEPKVAKFRKAFRDRLRAPAA